MDCPFNIMKNQWEAIKRKKLQSYKGLFRHVPKLTATKSCKAAWASESSKRTTGDRTSFKHSKLSGKNSSLKKNILKKKIDIAYI